MRSIAIIQFTIKLNDLKNAIVIVELEKCGCKQNGRRRGEDAACRQWGQGAHLKIIFLI